MPTARALLLPAVAALLLSGDVVQAAEKLKPEQVVKAHLEQGLGNPAGSAARPRQVRGSCQLTGQAVGTGTLGGGFEFTSDPARSKLSIRFGTDRYEGEVFSFDGQSVQVGFGQRPTSNRSALGRFLAANEVILREGLLGGALNASWPLLALETRGAKVSYEGTKKLDGRELHRLRYRARKGQNDLDVVIYLEPETWRHLATVYTASRTQDLTGNMAASSQQSDVYYRLEERFSDFKTQDGQTLPSRWKLSYEMSGGPGRTGTWNYAFEVQSVEPLQVQPEAKP